MKDIEKMTEVKREIDARVAAYFASAETYAGVALSSNGAQVLELLAEFTMRPSKRLRGILAIMAYEMFGGRSHDTALDLALTMELAQSYLLIIDDVMDRSEMRRGGPTVHQEYIRAMRHDFPKKRVMHDANMAAVIVGELAQHLASSVLNGVDEPAERVLRAEQLFHRNVAATAHGQIDDLFGSMGQLQTIDETLAMYVRKTCHYTFIAPLQLGAALAGASDDDLEALKEFGVHAGVAFQLQDDDIGMFGDERASGKSNLDDLREGKMTVLMRYALTHTTDVDQATVQAALGNQKVTHKQHAAVCTILEKSGARAYTRQAMSRANGEAIATLDAQAQWNASSKLFLSRLLESLTSRTN